MSSSCISLGYAIPNKSHFYLSFTRGTYRVRIGEPKIFDIYLKIYVHGMALTEFLIFYVTDLIFNVIQVGEISSMNQTIWTVSLQREL